jgi:hypothetical protein
LKEENESYCSGNGSKVGYNGRNSIRDGASSECIRRRLHVVVLDYERAVVGGGLKLNVAADAGQTEPPEAIIVGGVCLMHLHDLDVWERRANSADNGFDVVRLAHGSVFSVRVASPNDPKLSDSGPGARIKAQRREAKARAVPGFMAGSTARD